MVMDSQRFRRGLLWAVETALIIIGTREILRLIHQLITYDDRSSQPTSDSTFFLSCCARPFLRHGPLVELVVRSPCPSPHSHTPDGCQAKRWQCGRWFV